ncbi:MAG: LTA synthase family protein [Planctomycetes bacterium]|nr:LTA synthase family protein [Planctomycetota bacterium]
MWKALAVLVVAPMAAMSVMRLALALMSDATPGTAHAWASLLAMGARFDLRVALLLVAPLLLGLMFRWADPRRSPSARSVWRAYYTLVWVSAAGVYLADFAHYAYLADRLDVSALRFASNPWMSVAMVWESYPFVLPAFALAAVAAAASFGFAKCMPRTIPPRPLRRVVVQRLLCTVAVLAGIYGKVSFYPLRWSDAYAVGGERTARLVANPILHFVDTIHNRDEPLFDLAVLQRCFPAVARYLGCEESGSGFEVARDVEPVSSPLPGANVVVVMLESFSANKVGYLGNPLQASPNFDAVASRSLVFNRCFTPRSGTARGVFALMTGVPDTMAHGTASRDPRAIDQGCVVAQWAGYRKMFFLGGSANWANIRGVMSTNVPGLEIFEEGSYESPRVDVWGLCDYDLASEVNGVLRASSAPFFAFVQFSGNHRPYTVPEHVAGFDSRPTDAALLRRTGFQSQQEFDSFRFLDYSLGRLIDLASEEEYYQNTLFVFVGDNGVAGSVSHLPAWLQAGRVDEFHTPWAIWDPSGRVAPRMVEDPVSQLDVLPTMSGLIGQRVINRGLGRNVLAPQAESGLGAFIGSQSGLDSSVGLVLPGGILRVALLGGELEPVGFEGSQGVQAAIPASLSAASEIALGMFHLSQWKLHQAVR